MIKAELSVWIKMSKHCQKHNLKMTFISASTSTELSLSVSTKLEKDIPGFILKVVTDTFSKELQSIYVYLW